eukprot:Skav203365  [mRNA]  locus=scaffold940:166757:171457:+ [translate_table: standard]
MHRLKLRTLFLPRQPAGALPPHGLASGSAASSIVPGPQPHGSTRSHRQLSLDLLLPVDSSSNVASAPLKSRPLRVPGLDRLSDKFRHMSTTLRSDLPSPDLFPVESAQQLTYVLTHPPVDDTSPVYVWIFTDGSALFNIHDGQKRAAWSFVVVYQFADSSISFEGFQSAAVAPVGHQDSLPLLTTPDSHSAESEAIFRALCWCASSDTLAAGVPVCVVSDALTAMHGADGTWSSHSRPFLEQIVRPLYGALQSIGPLCSTWQRARSGVLFNELADHLAKCAARDPILTPALPHVSSDDLVPLQWLWLAWSSQLQDFGVDYQEDSIQLPVPPPTQLADVDCWPKATFGPAGHLRFQCAMSTFNVNTLTPRVRAGRTGAPSMPRKQMLCTQASDQAVLFLQETRTQAAGFWRLGSWFGFVGPALNGQGGVEIWCNSAVLFATVQAPEVDQQDKLLQTWFSVCLHHYFPNKPPRKHVSCLSPGTLALLKRSRDLRRALATTSRFRARAFSRHLFLAWRLCCPKLVKKGYTGHAMPPDPTWQRVVDFAIARHWKAARDLRKPLQIALRADEATFAEQILRAFQGRFDHAAGPHMWKALRPVLPKQRERARLAKHRYVATDQSFLQHFAQVENAQIHPKPQIAERIVQLNLKAGDFAATHELDAAVLPSLFDLENAIRRLRADKAVLGAVVAEALLADPPLAARLLFPLLMANAAHLQQCFSWKGGELFPLWKQKGALALTSSYRAILIAQTIPKLFHHLARAQLMSLVCDRFLPMQIGGLSHMGVEFAAHFIATMRHRARVRGVSHAVLYFDIKSAFYHARRQDLFPNVLECDEYEHEDSCVSSLLALPVMERLGVPLRLQAWSQQISTLAWSQISSGGVLVAPDCAMVASTGTRPGDPMADLSFSLIMQDIASRIVADLQPYLATLDSSTGPEPVGPVIWVDDFALYLEHTSPERLLDCVRHVAHCVGLDLTDLPACAEFLVSLGKPWKRVCSSLFCKAGLLDQIRAQIHVWRAGLADLHGGAPQQPPLSVPTDFACELCPATFSTAKALAVHRLTAHHRHALVRAYMGHPAICPAASKITMARKSLDSTCNTSEMAASLPSKLYSCL